MGRTGRPETSVNNYQSALRNIPEERGSQRYFNLWREVFLYFSTSAVNRSDNMATVINKRKVMSVEREFQAIRETEN